MTAAAKAAKLSPFDVSQLLDEFEQGLRDGRFHGPGAIAWRLTTGNWPPDAPEYAAKQARRYEQARRDARRRKDAQNATEAATEAAQLRELEKMHGQTLDAMPADRLDQLRATLPDTARNRPGLARWLLLLKLDEQTTATGRT